MSFKEGFLFILGLLLTAGGLFLTAGFVLLVTDAEFRGSYPGHIILLLVVGILPVVLGILLCVRMFRQSTRRKQKEVE